MAQSLARNLLHLVFSTKDRDPVLAEPVRAPLCAYAGGVFGELDSPVIAINACHDHLHVLFTLSKNHPLSRVVMEVKRATSKWLKRQGPDWRGFTGRPAMARFRLDNPASRKLKRISPARRSTIGGRLSSRSSAPC